MFIDIVEIWFGIANGQILSTFSESGRVLSFHVFIVLLLFFLPLLRAAEGK